MRRACIVGVFAGFVGTMIQSREAERQRVLAQSSAQEASAARDLERQAKEIAQSESQRASAEANFLKAEREVTGYRHRRCIRSARAGMPARNTHAASPGRIPHHPSTSHSHAPAP